jgi:hypothetical protein
MQTELRTILADIRRDDRRASKVVRRPRHMRKKYCRIMEWDVPEVEEKAARALIVMALREALAAVEAEV